MEHPASAGFVWQPEIEISGALVALRQLNKRLDFSENGGKLRRG
jgi:hypothetical protein